MLESHVTIKCHGRFSAREASLLTLSGNKHALLSDTIRPAGLNNGLLVLQGTLFPVAIEVGT